MFISDIDEPTLMIMQEEIEEFLVRPNKTSKLNVVSFYKSFCIL